MRIRKNAKQSPLLFTSSRISADTLLQPHLCQLNQSVWNVIPFYATNPPQSQVNEDQRSTAKDISVPSEEMPSKDKESDTDEDNLCPVITDWKGWQCGEKCRPGKNLCDFHVYLKSNPYAVNYKWTAARRERKRTRAEGTPKF